jgi:hypothetical protein
VGYKKAIFFKQLIAAFLLSVLSVVTVIQVLHSHASASTAREEKRIVKKTGLPGYYKAAVESSKCFICEYQLTKDADANFSIAFPTPPVSRLIVTEAIYSTPFQQVYAFVETRGPPSIS